VSVGVPKRQVGGRDLPPEEYDAYKASAGKLGYQAVQALRQSPLWASTDAEGREKAAEKAINKAREDARGGLFGRKTSAVPPPPPGFQIEGAAGGVNVFGDLAKAIPGIRFTSGYRTPEYQAELRARGYKPAYNSGHLDGSALDMLPPPGKSMGWLRNEVERLHPEARLLIHDGHLHATFPGYYGAPALGGAKGRLRNPNSGMPAPPAGFKLDAR